MYRTFNMGIGFMLVTPKENALRAVSHLKAQGEKAWVIGEIVKGKGVTIQ